MRARGLPERAGLMHPRGVSAEKPKPRRGRPPRDPSSPTSRASFHIGLRLSDARRDQLLRLVTEANKRAETAGLPPTFTASGLVVHAIHQWLDAETARLSRRR